MKKEEREKNRKGQSKKWKEQKSGPNLKRDGKHEQPKILLVLAVPSETRYFALGFLRFAVIMGM